MPRKTGSGNGSSSRRVVRQERSSRFMSTSHGPSTGYDYAATTSRPRTGRASTARPSTARPRTAVSTIGIDSQEIICAISESRGISPVVGLAFINLDTGEAVLSQINDTQTYVRTVHKLVVFVPTTILVVSSSAQPTSKLCSILEETMEDIGGSMVLLDRRYWAENNGIDYIQQLAFAEDVEAIKAAVNGNYYSVCCLAAVLKYVEVAKSTTFPAQSLRIKYEPSEGSLMIDLSTIRSLELLQNLNNARSKDCLFGLLNETCTPMGGRLLRSNVLQPLTNPDTLKARYDAVEELSTNEEMFLATRLALKPFLDVDRALTRLILVPVQRSVRDTEYAINNVIMLKQFIGLVRPVLDALACARSSILQDIRTLCDHERVEAVQSLIDAFINEDTTYVKRPLDLRNQRTYAVKSGVDGLLDVARQTYKEAMADALQHISDLNDQYGLPLRTKFDNVRQFYLSLPSNEVEEHGLPEVFINVYRKKNVIECQTLDLMKLNQKTADSHCEVLSLSDRTVERLTLSIREQLSGLFKISEGIAMLDMLAAFAQVVTTQDYTRPWLDDTLAIRAGRHPLREKIHAATRFVPNDFYATQQTRFQIVTGCNMSGKSTYIRSVALMTIMAQIGCFVPAQFASIPIRSQLFARIAADAAGGSAVEANVSTFAAEMREAAFILRNVDGDSLAIVDELGRGTSTRDGLAIAVAIAEALIDSRALVWFATHFRDLARLLAERSGVVNLHLQVETSGDAASGDERMEMLYRVASGVVQEEHYALKLARVLPLPADVLERAEHVARTLEVYGEQRKRRKGVSLGVVQARRRRLLLELKEHLVQARNARMEDEDLKRWLRDLQREFVEKMVELDDQLQSGERDVVEEVQVEMEEEDNGEETEETLSTTRTATMTASSGDPDGGTTPSALTL